MKRAAKKRKVTEAMSKQGRWVAYVDNGTHFLKDPYTMEPFERAAVMMFMN